MPSPMLNIWIFQCKSCKRRTKKNKKRENMFGYNEKLLLLIAKKSDQTNEIDAIVWIHTKYANRYWAWKVMHVKNGTQHKSTTNFIEGNSCVLCGPEDTMAPSRETIDSNYEPKIKSFRLMWEGDAGHYTAIIVEMCNELRNAFFGCRPTARSFTL